MCWKVIDDQLVQNNSQVSYSGPNKADITDILFSKDELKYIHGFIIMTTMYSKSNDLVIKISELILIWDPTHPSYADLI